MEKTFATPGRVLVVVHNEVGLVAITARQGDTTEVSLEADAPGAEELVGQAVVECRPSGGRHTVIVKIPHRHGMKFTRRNGVTVRVDVPPGADVDVATASASLELNGSIGTVRVKTASGDVTTDDVEALSAKTASGDIEVGTVSGELRTHTASGDLRSVRVGGRATVATTSGDAEIGSAGDHVDIRSTSGTVRLGEVSGDLTVVAVSGDVNVLSLADGNARIRSVSGGVEVGIARGATLGVDAETMSGTVHCDIPLDDAPAAHRGDPKVLLTVRSVSGDIHVKRGVDAFVR